MIFLTKRKDRFKLEDFSDFEAYNALNIYDRIANHGHLRYQPL